MELHYCPTLKTIVYVICARCLRGRRRRPSTCSRRTTKRSVLSGRPRDDHARSQPSVSLSVAIISDSRQPAVSLSGTNITHAAMSSSCDACRPPQCSRSGTTTRATRRMQKAYNPAALSLKENVGDCPYVPWLLLKPPPHDRLFGRRPTMAVRRACIIVVLASPSLQFRRWNSATPIAMSSPRPHSPA